MEDKILELTSELKNLREKYKSKCEKIKKANKKIAELNNSSQTRSNYNHIESLERLILDLMTSSLEKGNYDVKYKFEEKEYFYKNVSSFNIRYISESLCIHLAKKNGPVIYPAEIEIIDIKKIW